MSDPERKNFSEVFGDKRDRPVPEVTLRRMKIKEQRELGITVRDNVGIFWGRDLIAFVDFDDLFDAEGNRFHND